MTEKIILVIDVPGRFFENEMYILSGNKSLVVSSMILSPFDTKFYKNVLKVNMEYCPKCGRRL